MKGPRSRLLDFGAYLAVRFAVCLVQALSWDGAIALARCVAALAHRFDRRHRLVAQDNLRQSFPHLDEAAIQRIARASFDHLMIMAVEIIRLPRVLHEPTHERHLSFQPRSDRELAQRIAQTRAPLIVLTGHFGNWEVMSYGLGLTGFKANLIARRLDNPYLDRFVNEFRRKTGQTILDKNRDYDKIVGTLEQGKFLGIVGDQDAGPRGLFVSFLGRPASTFKSIALLSVQYSATILVVTAARVGHPMRYHINLDDVIDPKDYANSPDPVREITQRYSDALERAVLRHPEQYFWVHRRWKHQPKERQAKDRPAKKAA